MSEKKYSENDPERTLITLDQLSQTIEVMTSVVNRLRQHLSEQVLAKKELERLDQSRAADKPLPQRPAENRRNNTVVEVSKPESDTLDQKDDKTLH